MIKKHEPFLGTYLWTAATALYEVLHNIGKQITNHILNIYVCSFGLWCLMYMYQLNVPLINFD